MHSKLIIFGKRNDEEVITCQGPTMHSQLILFAKRNDADDEAEITC